MCGRFALAKTSEEIADYFSLKQLPDLPPRYNIAPSQQIAVIIHKDEFPERKLVMMRWGLIPSWAKDEKIGYKMINARAETVSEKPAFRSAFKKRRCLIPTDGFYEWWHKGKSKQPYFVTMKNKGLFAFAGIWDRWKSPTGEIVESCSIVTTDANSLIGKIHDRMPVIIQRESFGTWLNPVQSEIGLKQYMRPFSPYKMTTYPVSNMVNSPQNDSPACIKRSLQ